MDGGPFLGLGVPYLTALHRCRHDRKRLESDLAFLSRQAPPSGENLAQTRPQTRLLIEPLRRPCAGAAHARARHQRADFHGGITMTDQTTCAGVRENGRPCRSFAREGSPYCYWHEPERGGLGPERRPQPLMAASAPLQRAEDVYILLECVANHLATADYPDTRRAHSLSAVAAQLLRAIEQRDLESALRKALEDLQEARRMIDSVVKQRDDAYRSGEALRKALHDYQALVQAGVAPDAVRGDIDIHPPEQPAVLCGLVQ
jgi:hypothetical protein